MSHRVNREELLAALGRVSAGLSTKDFIEQSSCFVFEDDGYVVTFNDEVCCRTRVGFPAEFAGAVRATPLLKSLELLADTDVDVSVAKNATEFRVRGAGTKTWVRMEAKVVLPVHLVDYPDEWHPLPGDGAFEAAVGMVCAAAGGNAEEFVATCVHVTPDFVEASDRVQATRVKIDTGVTSPCLVRAGSLKHVIPLGMTRVGETPQWLHFRNKHTYVSVRRHVESYPDLTPVMGWHGEPAQLPQGAALAAKLGQVHVADDKNCKVMITLEPGTMTVTARGQSSGSERVLECDYDGDEIRFLIPPAQLAQMVADGKTTCEVGPTRLRVDGERWTYVTALGTVAPTPGDDDPPSDDPATGAEDETVEEEATY